MSKEGLDELKKTLSEEFSDKWEENNLTLEEIAQLMEDAKSLVDTNMGQIYSTLNAILSHYGIDPFTSEIGKTYSKAYASGTTNVPYNLRALIGENGSEIATTKEGLILSLDKGDGVISHQMTENLLNMAKGITPNVVIPNFKMPDFGDMRLGDTNIDQHYDSLIHIDGSADAATVDDIKRMSNELLEKSYKYTSQKIHDGYIKAGGRRVV